MLKGWLSHKSNDIISTLITKTGEHGILFEMEKVLKAHSIPPELRENSIGPESLSVQRQSPNKQYEQIIMNFISSEESKRETLNGSDNKFIKGSPSPILSSKERNQGRRDNLDPIKRVTLKGELNMTSLASEIIE